MSWLVLTKEIIPHSPNSQVSPSDVSFMRMMKTSFTFLHSENNSERTINHILLFGDGRHYLIQLVECEGVGGGIRIPSTLKKGGEVPSR